MRNGLDHLPVAKQRELEAVVRILFEEFDAALRSATQPWKKAGRILKIVPRPADQELHSPNAKNRSFLLFQ